MAKSDLSWAWTLSVVAFNLLITHWFLVRDIIFEFCPFFLQMGRLDINAQVQGNPEGNYRWIHSDDALLLPWTLSFAASAIIKEPPIDQLVKLLRQFIDLTARNLSSSPYGPALACPPMFARARVSAPSLGHPNFINGNGFVYLVYLPPSFRDAGSSTRDEVVIHR